MLWQLLQMYMLHFSIQQHFIVTRPVRLQEYFCDSLALSWSFWFWFDSQRYLWTITNKTWEECVFLKKKKTWVWVNNQNIHFEPILHLLLEITKTYWWYIYYDRLFPPSNTNLNFLSYNSEFVSHNYDFFILQLQVINSLFWVYISQFWHVFICSYLVILASFFLWFFSLHLEVQFLCFHHKDDLHKWTNCLWFFYI